MLRHFTLAATCCLVLPAIARSEQPRPTPDVLADWRLQDGARDAGDYLHAIKAIVKDLPASAGELRGKLDRLEAANIPADDARWAELYAEACCQRRAVRLAKLRETMPRIVFTKHYNLGGSHYAYTEGQSDAQAERHFRPGASLCLLDLRGLFGEVRTLVDDRHGVIRDPDVSYDGTRVLFAWKKSLNEDDYHLYEMQLAPDEKGGKVRQLTSGLGFADYEGAYLPSGHIVFNSTRCVQTVDCWWTEVSNFYTCDGDGRYLRRLGFDQVHTNYPTVTPDGRVLYTRWDYSDRGQIYPQGLFQMNLDGTGQAACYGNNSWFPTAILHARAIPGTQKIVAVFSGHHTMQTGWLGILDPRMGREENAGTQLIAPVRETPAVRVDRYGQSGHQFQYPYPINEREFLVAMRPVDSGRHYGIYWIDADGRRELLASDPAVSCNQPVPLAARPLPPPRPSTVDYRRKEGVFYLQDIYAGPGLSGVPRGTVKRLRVVSILFRPVGIGENRSHGPAGGALASTPVSIGNGAWDPKVILGEATVHADGSALFAVSARTPVYFQALDERGYAVQTMRSWSTLQPGEKASCIGCHESKNAAPPQVARTSLAMRAGVERMAGIDGSLPRGFSFAREIQPILDRHCTECHCEPPPLPGGRKPLTVAGHPGRSFSLLGKDVVDEVAKRRWSESYLALTGSRPRSVLDGPVSYTGRSDELVNWIGTQSVPAMLPPYSAGAAKSRLMEILEEGHGGKKLSREELAKLACWIDLLVPYCGDYAEANAWSPGEMKRYEHFVAKRRRMEQIESRNVEAWIKARGDPWE